MCPDSSHSTSCCCGACGCGMPRLSAHHAEVVLLVVLTFLQFQFAVWSQDAFIDLGGRWVGAVRTRGFAFISGLLSLWHTSFHSSCLSQYRLSYCWVTSTSSRSELGLPSINSQSLSHSGRPL